MKPVLLATLAASILVTAAAQAVTTSVNSGSLGAVGNATNADAVVLGGAGPLAAPGDTAAAYSGGANTTLSYKSALNPSSSSPFTIEFWVKPTSDVQDSVGPSPVFNRVTASPRSGWVFFQRSAATGFNFAMYSGVGTSVGLQITGGPYNVGAWNHVVAVFDGTTPTLWVNGAQSTSTATGSGYVASSAATLSLGAYDTGSNPFTGSVDETAFYSTALTGAQIQSHYNAAANVTPGFYSNMIVSDGAVLYLNNIPEPTSAGLMLLGLAATQRRRRK